jgi:hypothetical protein
MSDRSLHQRYISGKFVPVWDEMIALGDSIRAEPILSDALAVAREVVDRSHRNLRVIHDRLVGFGYEFAKPENALVEAGPEAVEQIRALEERFGAFPLLIREWYLRLASVDFSQSQSQQVSPTESGVGGLGFNCTLIMQSLSRCQEQAEWLARQYAEDDRHAREYRGSTYTPEHFPPVLPLGPNASNCDMMGFRLPNLGVDGVFYNDGAGSTYFIDHLRTVFEWGGFPFCQWYLGRSRHHSLSARPDVEKVLPVLRNGLLPI